MAKAASKGTAKKVASKNAVKRAAPKAGQAAAKPDKSGQKKGKPGGKYSCEVCGLVVSVDEACGCVEACDIICCGEQMKAGA